MEIFTPRSEFHLELVQKLYEQNIPYEARFLSDERIQMEITQPYSMIDIADEYADQVEPMIRDLEKEKPVEATPPTKFNSSYLTWGLVAYALIATVLCAKYYYQSGEALVDPNFDLRWNASSTQLSYYKKSNGELVFRHFDQDYDWVYERLETYQSGIIIERYLDANSDGFYEESINYDVDGQYTGKWLDRNGDTYYDYGEIVLENADTIRLVDQNGNGVFERLQP